MKRRTLARSVRKWLTERTMDAAVIAAPHLRPGSVDAIETLIAAAAPRLPVMARTIATNMKSVGVYSSAVRRDHFARLGMHFADELRILSYVRASDAGRSAKPPEGLAQLARERVRLDGSFDNLREAVSHGRGVILMYPHTVSSSLVLARLMQEVPLTVLTREAKDPSRRKAKERWCEAIGFDFVARREKSNSDQRRTPLIERLRQGRVIVIAPDVPQKQQKGKPVRFFDRAIYLPRGAAILSHVTGAPLVTMVPRPQERNICLVTHGAIMPETSSRTPGARQAAIQQRLQEFADHLAAFICDHPSLWYFWGDKRWTRVFRDDPKFVSSLTSTPAPGEASSDTTCSTRSV